MVNDYLCPVCRGHIRVENFLVVAARTAENKLGLIFLNPEIGNYTKSTHPSFKLVEGEAYTINCPICHAILNREENSSLVKVLMINEKDEEVEVYFSGIIGEKCTYVIKDKIITDAGSDKEKYQKYFDIPEEYKKYL